MKSKQLANVLIKILGLSICVYGIPRCVSELVIAWAAPGRTQAESALISFASAVSAGVVVLLGVLIIAASRNIAAWMFKNDDE